MKQSKNNRLNEWATEGEATMKHWRTKLGGESEKYAKGTKIKNCRVQRKARQEAGESSERFKLEKYLEVALNVCRVRAC